MQWSTACPDWESRIVSGQSLITFPPLFPAEAEAALEHFRDFTLVDVAGRPRAGDACRPWVFDFVGAVFGAYDPDSGRRLINNFLLCVSKKNAKSTIAAGIMLAALLRNWRDSAEYLILAPTVEAAGNCYKPARDMVKASEDLDDLFNVQDHIRTITHISTGSTLKVVAADSATVTGKKATGVLVDELWEFGKRPDAEDMLREATGGLASRPEGFVIYLTTQSEEPPAGVFKQRLDYFRAVRDGKVRDPRSLPVIYEFPRPMIEDRRCRDPANFWITNPNLGKSVDEEFLHQKLAEAEHAGEHAVRGFLAKHVNVEAGGALNAGGWPGAEHWEAATDPTITLAGMLSRCEVCTVGIDGGGLDDLLGLTVIGRERGTRRWLSWSRAWAHPIVLQRRKEIATRLRDFAEQGDLVIVSNLGDDLAEAAAVAKQVRDAGLLPEKAGIGLDPAGIGSMVDALAEVDIAGDMLAGIPQGWRLNGAIKASERGLAQGTLVHADQPLMDWCVGNAKIEPRGNAVTITKAAAGKAKIDPLAALFNAAELMARNPVAHSPNVAAMIV